MNISLNPFEVEQMYRRVVEGPYAAAEISFDGYLSYRGWLEVGERSVDFVLTRLEVVRFYLNGDWGQVFLGEVDDLNDDNDLNEIRVRATKLLIEFDSELPAVAE